MILLNVHPDISRGRDYVLALMFDMNDLWEQYAALQIRRHLREPVPCIVAQCAGCGRPVDAGAGVCAAVGGVCCFYPYLIKMVRIVTDHHYSELLIFRGETSL
ncbi:hypothetical protein NATSA_12485 [Natronogracilivirgula saccharolytica]|uniref:Uncharacterized protein n=1 Tax=Natronogracilivirga saccharolytica TaxID=2812953 RepID=A0A8J7RTB2_9BACT|nr:hypothetical protein [Natronogracilivirga saccharolytica]